MQKSAGLQNSQPMKYKPLSFRKGFRKYWNLCSTYIAGVVKGSSAILEDAVSYIKALYEKRER